MVGCHVEVRLVTWAGGGWCRGGQQSLWEWLGVGDTEQVSKYIDNHKSHVSTLESVLTNVERGETRKYPEERFNIARTAMKS